MEISGAALQRCSIGSVRNRLLLGSTDGGAPRRAASRVRVPARATRGGAVFFEEGHLQYYEEGRAKQEKKRAKLIKTLKKDLSELYSIGFGVQPDQSNKIAEAAEQLLEQLNQIKVEEKEMKKKSKEEKKAVPKMCRKEDSSSSSSESSESDCEERQILQLSDLKTTIIAAVPTTVPDVVTPVPLSLPVPAPAPMERVPVEDVLSGKIEVCIGGKCKKSGSIDLLNEFQKKVGSEGGAMVVGCKCMGKCKEGPNVRFSSSASGSTGPTGKVQGGEPVSSLRDQLCIGIGLDDVDAIVAHFLGQEAQDGAGSFIPA